MAKGWWLLKLFDGYMRICYTLLLCLFGYFPSLKKGNEKLMLGVAYQEYPINGSIPWRICAYEVVCNRNRSI